MRYQEFLAPLCLLLVSACSGLEPAASAPEGPAGFVASALESTTYPWQTLARSRQGRPLLAAQLGAGDYRLYLIGGIHGDEPDGRGVLDAVLWELTGSARMDFATLRVVRDLNPDGSALHRRANAAGVDLNRNWPARNFRPAAVHGPRPLSEPETAAVHRDLLAFDPDLVVILHSSVRGPFVNFDGPAHETAEAFVAAAAAHEPAWRVVADMGYPTPGSLGSLVGVDQGLPILTLEFHRGSPANAAALHAGLAAMLAAAQK